MRINLQSWITRQQGQHICHCGCGEPIKILKEHHSRGIPRFINGHSARVNNQQCGKGYKLGKSTFKKVSETYQPKEGERWAEKKTEVKNGKRLLEIIEEEGISNRHLLRGEINIIYFLDLAKAIPEWPRPFKMCDRNRELWV